jgi:hypothetical protein
VSLQDDVADLLKLHVGVDATLGGVQLTIKVSRRRYCSRCASTTWPGSSSPRTVEPGSTGAISIQPAGALPAGQPDPCRGDEIASAVLVHEYGQVS